MKSSTCSKNKNFREACQGRLLEEGRVGSPPHGEFHKGFLLEGAGPQRMSRREARPFYWRSCWHSPAHNRRQRWELCHLTGGHRVQEAQPQDCSTGGRGCGWAVQGAAEKGSNSLADVSAKNIACKLVQPLQKAVWWFLRLKMELPCEAALPLLGIYLGKRIQKDACIPVFTAALFMIARAGKQPRCPSADKRIKMGGGGCTHNRTLLRIKKEWNNAICSNMGGPRDYQSQTETFITYVWSLKYDKGTYETKIGTSLMAQGLRLHAPKTGRPGLDPWSRN